MVSSETKNAKPRKINKYSLLLHIKSHRKG